MNKPFILITFLFYIMGCSEKRKMETNNNFPSIKVENKIFQLDTILVSDTIYVKVKIYNIGKSELKLINAGVSCGCTSAGFNDTLLSAGDSTILNITYIPKNDNGEINKSIIIESNAKDPFEVIRIKGFVIRDSI